MRSKNIRAYLQVILLSFGFHSFADQPIRFNNSLPSEETDYVASRLELNHKTISRFLGKELLQTPHISVGFSGGGLRASIFALAMLRGLQEIGLYDGLRYMNGVSGSAWTLLDLLARNISLDDFNSHFRARLQVDWGNISNFNWFSIMEALSEKKKLEQDVNLVDFYGCMAADALLSDMAGNGQDVEIDTFRRGLAGKRFPFPIVSVSLVGEGLNQIMPWVEITPYYMGSGFQGAYLDVQHLGNHFQGCKQVSKLPAQKLSYFLGLVGTFYCIDPNEIAIVKPEVRQFLKYDPAFGYRHFEPSIVPNFLFKCENRPLNQYENLEVIDAGHEIDLGIIPLLRKGRVPDLILLGDAAWNTSSKSYPELIKASIYAKKHGLPFPDLRSPKKIGEYIDVFMGSQGVPTIIYYANPNPFPTLKTSYSAQEFDKLSLGIIDLVKQSSLEIAGILEAIAKREVALSN